MHIRLLGLLVALLPVHQAISQRTKPAAMPPQTVAATPVLPTDTLRSQLVTRPTIMVFPFFREGQSIRRVIEDDPYNRVLMARVKEAFDRRGYSTQDFMAKVRNLNVSEVLTADTQTDLKTSIIQSSGADIAVEVEYTYAQSPTGNEVSVVLNAYESSSAASLANKVGSSGKFYSVDVAKLTSRAVDPLLDDFMGLLQLKFTDIVQNGRYMSIEFGIGEGSDLTMNTEVGTDGLPLSDALESWVSDHTRSYHIQGVTALKSLYDVVRVPRTDAQGRVLTTSRYSIDLLKFGNNLFLVKKPDRKLRTERLIRGNTLLITFR